MSIQQSVNQLIGTSTVAAGLYAHQPAVQAERQRKAEVEKVNKGITESADKLTAGDLAASGLRESLPGMPKEKLDDLSHTSAIAHYEKTSEELDTVRDLYQRMGELDPSKAEFASGMDMHIQHLQRILAERASYRQELLDAREMILKGTSSTGGRVKVPGRGIEHFKNNSRLNGPLPKPREVIKYGD
jgi:hypothetical protein